MASRLLWLATVSSFKFFDIETMKRYQAADGTTMFIGPATGMLIIRSEHFNLSLGDRPTETGFGKKDRDYLYVSMNGNPSPEDYRKLATLNSRIDGRLVKALIAHSYPEYAEQIINHGLAIQAASQPLT